MLLVVQLKTINNAKSVAFFWGGGGVESCWFGWLGFGLVLLDFFCFGGSFVVVSVWVFVVVVLGFVLWVVFFAFS